MEARTAGLLLAATPPRAATLSAADAEDAGISPPLVVRVSLPSCALRIRRRRWGPVGRLTRIVSRGRGVEGLLGGGEGSFGCLGREEVIAASLREMLRGGSRNYD